MRPKLIALGNCLSGAHLYGASGAAGTGMYRTTVGFAEKPEVSRK
jgi:hypothetical protein